jgi:uncharacterized protein YjlB
LAARSFKNLPSRTVDVLNFAARRKALETIPQVKVPTTDLVMGADGPLVRLWRR